MYQLSKTFKALCDAHRLQILHLLMQRELFVCEISRLVQLSNSTVSQHLSILREAGFINYEKEGRWVKYRINRHSANPYAVQLQKLLRQWLKSEQKLQVNFSLLEETHPGVKC
ncbi:hypothetical protein B1H10_06870 [candidate division KSB1 bacterium 4484_188]|nr:MAG: hypothetical protein B1H10_06870 [candidate division KSB1 bacterium 4484_188]HFE64407.1 ArsR family transcriptional regulator [Caldithrix sp.]